MRQAGRVRPGVRHFAALAGVAVLLAPQPGRAAQQDPAPVADAVRRAVAATAPANATIALGPVLGARYMRACTSPLTVTVTGTLPYLQATAHCGAPVWILYVSVTVDAHMAVVVASRPITAGQTLESGDLALRDEPISLYAGRSVFYQAEDAVGATAVMSLPLGAILTGSSIEEPLVVQAGQSITVDARSGGVDISITGTAEQPGRLGDTIIVTNPSSGRRFPAVVTRSGALVQLGS
ncbi:flagellar basal body P-ring formation chaperone FlgA [Acidisoma sp.]|uniref:flagellar basal body P-ring formation chaperone FlgA n=1 Tax=Acidisoma sp. TaxID=1872115 RepID=UPI003B00FD4F